MPSHSWLPLFRQVEQETDLSQLHQLVMDAEYAILERMREMRSLDASDPTAVAEFEEMRAALDSLLRMKTERLKWPPLKLSQPDGDSAA
jgi:hypothetical protein